MKDKDQKVGIDGSSNKNKPTGIGNKRGGTRDAALPADSSDFLGIKDQHMR